MRISNQLLQLLLLGSLMVLPLYSAAGEPRPIGQLQTQSHWIVIYAAADGPRYTIKTHDGVIVEEQLTEHLLASLYPDVHETLRNAIASPPVNTVAPDLPIETLESLESESDGS